MFTLALDTSTPNGGSALIRDHHVLDVVDGDVSRPHGVRLPGDVSRLLERHDVPVETVDAFGVIAGPGGFTGLRVGLATIQGLALVHRRPVVAVGTLEALCRIAVATCQIESGDTVGVWMDAHRGEVFSALYGVAWPSARESSRWSRAVHCGLECRTPPAVESPADVAAGWRQAARAGGLWVVGNATPRYGDVLTGMTVRHVPGGTNLAPMVGLIAEATVEAGGGAPPHRLVPMYVRRPDAEIARDRRTT